MNSLTDISSILQASFIEIWLRFISWVPNVIAAIVVFLIIVFIAKALGKLSAKVLEKAYLDKAAETTGIKTVLERIGFKLKLSTAIGWMIKWFLYAVALVAAADILQLSQISEFLRSIVLYIPNVIIAVVILIVGTLISNFVQTLVKETAVAAKIEIAQFLSDVARWAIIVFTVMAAMIQLNVATELTQILFMGFVFMISLAGGIAFGLGGKDKAQEIIDKLSKN